MSHPLGSYAFHAACAFAACLLPCLLTGCDKPAKGLFGVYSANLDGSDMRPLIQDSYRELNHARVSPDGRLLTFTRYNKVDSRGLAMEEGGYLQTEIAVMGLDGSSPEVFAGPPAFEIAANGNWAPDGKSIVFAGKRREDAHTRLYSVALEGKLIEAVQGQPDLFVADPHLAGGKMVFTVREPDGRNLLYLKDRPDGVFSKLTDFRSSSQRSVDPPPGDYDPKLSPDAAKVAFMRRIDEGPHWHIVALDLESRVEKDISAPSAVDAVPEWSQDGGLLVFWHVDPDNLRNCGLYTAKPDGSDRKRIVLPRGYFYSMPAFFPDGASGAAGSKIVFSARAVPGL